MKNFDVDYIFHPSSTAPIGITKTESDMLDIDWYKDKPYIDFREGVFLTKEDVKFLHKLKSRFPELL